MERSINRLTYLAVNQEALSPGGVLQATHGSAQEAFEGFKATE
jgi:hypothetical protein